MIQKSYLLSLALGLLLGASTLIAQLTNVSKVINNIQEKGKKGEPIKLSEFTGFIGGVPMPAKMQTVLSTIAIKVPKVKILPTVATATEFSVEGGADLKGIDVTVGVTGKKEDGVWKMSIKLALPKGIDFQKAFPELGAVSSMFKKFSFGKSYFIFSDYDYKDMQLNLAVERGFNFAASADLTGPLEKFKHVIDQLTKTKFLIAEQFEIMFAGIIKPTLTQSHFGVVMPYKIGIDFTQSPFKFKDPYLRRLYTAGFNLNVDLTAKVTFVSGLFVEFKDQKAPLEFTMDFEVDPKGGVSVEAFMKGMYQPAFGAKWLGLGPNIGLAFGIMVEPPWLKELGFTGGLTLGEVLKEATATVAIDILNGNFLIDTKVKKLDVDDLVKLLVTMSAKTQKKDIVLPKIPTIEFTDLKLIVVPTPMTAFKKDYSAGVEFGGNIQIDKFKGGVETKITTEPARIYASGQLYPLEAKSKKGVTIFRMTGKGKDRKFGTPDDAALLEIDFGPRRAPADQKLYISSLIEVPPVKFKEAIELKFEGGKFTGEVGSELEKLFTGTVTISFSPTNPDDFLFRMAFDQKFAQLIQRKTKEAMTKFENKAKDDLNKARAKVEQIDEKMDALRRKRNEEFRKLETGAAAEVKKAEAELKRHNEELARQKEECEKIPPLKRPFSKVCLQVVGKAFKSLGHYIKTGTLKAGQKIIEGVDKAVRKIDDALKLEEAAQKVARAGLKVAEGSVTAISKASQAVTSSFDFKSGSLEVNGLDLKEGKLPKVSLNIKIAMVTINLKDLQFDFKHPDALFESLAKQLIESFKKE